MEYCIGYEWVLLTHANISAVNLAVALANMCQLKVGLLDADIYGPSVPTMMQIHEKPDVTEGAINIVEFSP